MTALDPDAIERREIEARRLADAATHETELVRYEHGGGRSFVDEQRGRKLVADYYHEEDREFYHTCRTLVPALCDDIKALREALAHARLTLEETDAPALQRALDARDARVRELEARLAEADAVMAWELSPVSKGYDGLRPVNDVVREAIARHRARQEAKPHAAE